MFVAFMAGGLGWDTGLATDTRTVEEGNRSLRLILHSDGAFGG